MLWSALLLGFLGSLHCIGMCGPIAFMLPLEKSNSFKKIIQISMYHAGRLFAYAFLGLVFGLLGKSFYLFGLQQQLSIAIGVIIILAVVLPYKLISKLPFAKIIYPFISKIKSKLGKAFKKNTNDAFLTIGFLNGFLPCGLVYIAIFSAIGLANAWQASLYMALFGLGTIPLMTTAIYFSKFLTQTVKTKIKKVIPVFVFIIGLLFILRGLGLGIPYLSPAPIIESSSSKIECH